MLKFKVSYYDDTHEKLLNAYPNSNKLKELVEKGFSVDETELLIYSMFWEQRDEKNWRTYEDMRSKLPSRLVMYKEYFDFTGETAKSSTQPLNNKLTQSLGEGAALSIISNAYELTEADWQKIDITKNKDLDYHIASDGFKIIEVEAKGTIVGDDKITPGISNMKKNIADKKDVQRNTQNNKKYIIWCYNFIPNYKPTTGTL